MPPVSCGGEQLGRQTVGEDGHQPVRCIPPRGAHGDRVARDGDALFGEDRIGIAGKAGDLTGMDGNAPKKVIVVPGRIVNIVV